METVRITGDERASLLAKRDKLTEAQRRVYDLLIDGCSEKEIATQLHLSPNTVHSHIQAIYAIFDVHSKARLIALARQL
jgi:DNA-binding CsgD family transcriptional regulator